MAHYSVNLLTPSKVITKGLDAEVVLIPSSKGEMMVLPEHTHLITKLDIGVLSVKTAQGELQYVINGGVAKVLHKDITILANECELADDIDIEKAARDKKLALEKMAGKEHLSDQEFNDYQNMFYLSEARLKVGKHK